MKKNLKSAQAQKSSQKINNITRGLKAVGKFKKEILKIIK